MDISRVLKDEVGIYVPQTRKSGRQAGQIVKGYGEIKDCLTCNEEFFTPFHLKGIYCSKRCAHLGKKPSEANRIALKKALRGHKRPDFKGGIKHDSKGYLKLLKPNHPNADATGYIFEHRYVMSIYIGRPLKREEIVHHKNHNKIDNRIENLEIMSLSDHMKHHHQERFK